MGSQGRGGNASASHSGRGTLGGEDDPMRQPGGQGSKAELDQAQYLSLQPSVLRQGSNAIYTFSGSPSESGFPGQSSLEVRIPSATDLASPLHQPQYPSEAQGVDPPQSPGIAPESHQAQTTGGGTETGSQEGGGGRSMRKRNQRSSYGGGGLEPPVKTVGNGRYDSSLGLLTKKFLELVEGAGNGTLDLNKAAEKLGVQKRRIYDITNVLEGIGMIEKRSKNNIQWKGTVAGSQELREEAASLLRHLRQMTEEDVAADQALRQVRESLERVTEQYPHLLFVTNEDIKGLPEMRDELVFAVKYPDGTRAEFSDPNADADTAGRGRYWVHVVAPTGSLEVFSVNYDPRDWSPQDETGAAGPSGDKGRGEGDGVEGAGREARGAGPGAPPSASTTPTKPPKGPASLMSPGIMRLQTCDADPTFWFEDTTMLGLDDILMDPLGP